MDAIRTFEVYLVGEKPYGCEIEKPYPASTWGYDETFKFFGKSARLVVVSNDGGVDRSIALRFAAAIAFGHYRTLHIDLKEMSSCWLPPTKK